MQLSLHYQESAQREACAAFLRGSDPGAWLREIGSWNVAPTELSCYVVPESLQSVQAAGLLVIGQTGATWAAGCLEPYGVEANCLYVPLHARLWPATTPEELQKALLWPRQLFHPTIGLVGFADTDVLDLVSLLDCPAPRTADWSWAQPGLPLRPTLQQVRAAMPTAEEVIQSFQESVGTTPLAQLPGPKSEQDSAAQNLLDSISRGLLKAALPALQGLAGVGAGLGAVLGGLFSLAPGGLGNSTPCGPNSPSPLQRLENWMTQHLADLEKKREGEIERLLALFSENPEEALKYAIPLGGKYENRGAAPPSARLGTRSTLFDLSRLGGGGRVDVWNVDAYQSQLTDQYHQAAKQELAAGRFKKAAYIYAHLLGSYYQAAKALEQGGYFREAAVLYKDHLKDLSAAAGCLERGGLLLEAAELYVHLEKHEKAGDLYQQLGQSKQAAVQFERSVALALDVQNHTEAARLLHDKLSRPDRALTTLLQGWHSTTRPEACLENYLHLLARQDPQLLSQQVRPLFDNHTLPAKRPQFLQVLATISEAYPSPELLHNSREVAYEVISQEASAGVLTNLPLLKKFLPDDRLIASDCGRFTTQQRTRPSQKPRPSTAYQLESSIQWHQAVCHRNQFLALGFYNGRLHLARGNWYGHLEYYSWLPPVAPDHRIRLIADATLSNQVLLFLPDAMSVEMQHLPKNKHFNEALTVYCPESLPPSTVGLAVLPGRAFLALARNQHGLTGYRFNDAVEYAPFNLQFSDGDYETPTAKLGRSFLPVLFRNGRFYAFDETVVLEFSQANGQVGEMHFAHAVVHSIIASPYVHDVELAIVTSAGITLWNPARSATIPEQTLGKEHPPVDTQLVAANSLVVVEQAQAVVYHTQEAGMTPHVIGSPDGGSFIAVLPTSTRNQFALLTSNGGISLHLNPFS
ncbi:hypothetical protein [Hymenobacter wooponensis]|uniref:MoxR-vWA-beta-propeller ternary system domain-containing protein n=1 Tax=Hymenobacter wooponensis TaxID=1525360 RepID=A0A4Z0MJQ7_9BACT|nr:hypothetical protein [Hymenobacter wooponensis]TGD79547.1 hypothetical protein EU557_15090 [Hymenobacter wooponensis]